MTELSPSYLQPYLRAVARHGGGFRSLLWASPSTQAARFNAIRRICDLNGKVVLDAGCGRADLLSFLIDHGVDPAEYLGLEAVDALAEVAETRLFPRATIIRGDFVRDRRELARDADVIVFSGSLNTLTPGQFRDSLRAALAAAREAVAFNFLSSPSLAAADHLTWYRPADVQRMIGGWAPRTRTIADYLDGDCTMAMWKREGPAAPRHASTNEASTGSARGTDLQ